MRDEAIVDPVTGFVYPAEWVGRCTDPAALTLAASGLGVLTADGSVLRRGFTTGTTAAAACRAAVLSLAKPVDAVSLLLPCGLEVVVPARGAGGRGEARKDSGDYHADVTAGLAFVAVAEQVPAGVEVEYGGGVGRFVRETPRYPLGSPAVSPTARATIEGAVGSAAASVGLPGVWVRLSVPDGAAVAAQTLNPRIGVEGGISVLGSTGLVEPWDDHLSESALERVEGAEQVVLTTGRLGLRYARLLFPDREVVLVGVHLGRALAAAKGEVTVCGLPGLVMKFMDAEVLAGTGCATVEELTGTPAWQGVMERTFASFRAAHPTVRVVVVARDGTVLGDSG
ncbi:cobalt-precorrin-5B (C(1))-methyltransferase [Methanofollis formosanus]|uniref:cobalt-precorrin-5B (C(1))-methyltransferase n=1 Tax=Methanofollis formosanus TaxID=299308 RepID=UPI0031B9FFED